MYSYAYEYYADNSHNLSIQLLYTFCKDFNYSHALDWLDQSYLIGSHISGKYYKSDLI